MAILINVASVKKVSGMVVAMCLFFLTSTGQAQQVDIVTTLKDDNGWKLQVNGNDFFEAYDAAGDAIDRARAGEGPTLLHMKLARYYGHFEGDAQTYRAQGEVDDMRANKDCIKIFQSRVEGAGVVQAAEFDAIEQDVVALIDEAVRGAEAAPLPGREELLTDVYVAY